MPLIVVLYGTYGERERAVRSVCSDAAESAVRPKECEAGWPADEAGLAHNAVRSTSRKELLLAILMPAQGALLRRCSSSDLELQSASA